MHFDTAHSSAHEGTNHGMKGHSCGTKPTMKIDTSAKTLINQTRTRIFDCESTIFQDATCTHKKWSDLPTSNYTVTVAEGILSEIMRRSILYQAQLVSIDKNMHAFQVLYLGTSSTSKTPSQNINTNLYPNKENTNDTAVDIELSPIPRFERIRTVTVSRKGIMFCTCKHFERMGQPCVYQVAVAISCHDNPDTTTDKCCFKGFTCHDIAVWWWSSYMYYAYRKTHHPRSYISFIILLFNL